MWIRLQHDFKERLPLPILFGHCGSRTLVADGETTPENEILEAAVTMTERTDMPPQSIEPERVRSDPPPYRVRILRTGRLVFDVDAALCADSHQHSTQH